MTIPQIRLASGMVLVAVTALNLGAIRALYRLNYEPTMPSIALWGWGALLMLNVLGAVLVLGNLGKVDRRFVGGFEAFGGAALALFIAGSMASPEILIWPSTLLRPIIKPLMDGHYVTTTAIVVGYLLWTLMTALPMLAIALLGGLLVRHARGR